MKDARKTRSQLIEELCALRRRLEALGDHLGSETAPAKVARRAEESLRASNEELQAICDGVVDGILIVDTQTRRFVRANPAMQAMLGHTERELLSMSVPDVHPPDQVPDALRKFAEAAKGTKSYWPDLRLLRKDGGVLHVDIATRPIEYHGRACVIGFFRDITERKQAEQALRQSEERLHYLLTAGPAVIYTAHPRPDYQATFISENVKAQLGYEAQCFTDDPHFWAHHIHPGDAPRIFARLPLLLEQDYHAHEYRFRHNDGTWRWMHDEMRLVRDVHGNPSEIIGYWADITERKRAEDELWKFKTITDRASFGAAMAKLDGHLTYVNDAFAQMHGYKPAELVGRHLSIFHGPEQMERVNALNTRLAREGQYTAEEVWHKRKDGSVFPAMMNGTLIRDERGDPAFISATAVDVSQRVRAQEIIRDSEERYRTLVENIGDGVALVAEGKIQYASPSLCRMLGRDVEEVVGRSPAEMVVPESAKQVAQRVQALLAGEPARLATYELLRPNGGRPHVEVMSSFLLQEGKPAVLTALRDITERRELEEQRARLEAQLREAHEMHAVGRVAAGIAHDFGNLLAVARNSVSRLQELAPTDRAYRETLDVLARTVEEATSITQSLLVFTRRLPAERQAVDLCRLLEESLPMLRHLLPGTLRVDAKCERPAWVNADAGQMRQVLLNLTINARDAMPEHGTLYIRVGPATAQDRAGGQQPDAVRLTLRDTGAGISAEVRPHIFEPFFTTKPGGRGTGLGLATVQSIVRDHGGQITVESEVGRGTTFTITLPPLAAKLARAAGSVHPPPRGQGELILLEESNRHVRRLINATLHSWGYDVLLVEEGTPACETYLASAQRIALLILNADPPAPGGVECVRTLRAAGHSVPAILTATQADPDLANNLGPHTVLIRKPFQMEELGRHLSQLLAARPAAGRDS